MNGSQHHRMMVNTDGGGVAGVDCHRESAGRMAGREEREGVGRQDKTEGACMCVCKGRSRKGKERKRGKGRERERE